ncbi:phosphatidate cytidylyltransferase [Paludifilum halophilum]|nr:phosphatidate cytidylyltransferase [Paludifilum halophilum]
MRQRIVTGVSGGSVFLVLLWVGHWWYAGFISALATISYIEFCSMKGIRFSRPQALIGLCLMWLLLLTGMADQQMIGPGWFLDSPDNILAGMILFLVFMVLSRNRLQVDEAAYLFLGSLYIGYGFSYMIQARMIVDGFIWSLLALVVTWVNDTGAYFTGKRWGKRKLWPSVSPNKTVEGSLGGIFLSVLVSGLFGLLYPELGVFSTVLFIGFLVSVVGQVGDLVESALKRTTGVKDSGSLLPGHGGILDRFDSLLLVFPVLYLIQLI